MSTNFLYVALGGAIGAILRYAISLVKWQNNFPWSTFIVNIVGCFLLGFVLALFKQHKIDNFLFLLLASGICGGFTTFSAFSLDSLTLLQNAKFLTFGFYIFTSVFLGLLATYLGLKFGNLML
jgi:CrcB protein